jgi:hypothetical protein
MRWSRWRALVQYVPHDVASMVDSPPEVQQQRVRAAQVEGARARVRVGVRDLLMRPHPGAQFHLWVRPGRCRSPRRTRNMVAPILDVEEGGSGSCGGIYLTTSQDAIDITQEARVQARWMRWRALSARPSLEGLADGGRARVRRHQPRVHQLRLCVECACGGRQFRECDGITGIMREQSGEAVSLWKLRGDRRDEKEERGERREGEERREERGERSEERAERKQGRGLMV